MNTILSIKWETYGNAAEHLVLQVIEHLDRRKKHLKDDTLNWDVVTAILTHRSGPFEVRYTQLPKEHKEAVREAVECLCGPVLKTCKGTSTYALRDEFKAPEARFITKVKGTDGKRPLPTVTTTFGTIYRDGTHSEVPFDNIALLGFVKPSLVEIVAPHRHWGMFVDSDPVPSRQWRGIEEVEAPHPSHEDIMGLVLDTAHRRGFVVHRYGDAGFLTNNPDGVGFILDEVLTRFTGKAGQKPLLNTTDIYGREHVRWGMKL
jgi:hypothetical protein